MWFPGDPTNAVKVELKSTALHFRWPPVFNAVRSFKLYCNTQAEPFHSYNLLRPASYPLVLFNASWVTALFPDVSRKVKYVYLTPVRLLPFWVHTEKLPFIYILLTFALTSEDAVITNLK